MLAKIQAQDSDAIDHCAKRMLEKVTYSVLVVISGEQEYNRLNKNDEQRYCPACYEEAAQENELDDMFANQWTEMNVQGLRVGQINCCSLIGRFADINMLLQNCNIDVLGISETHLNQRIEDKEIAIEGYELQRFDIEHKKGGGCVVYYREDLDVVPRPDLKNNEIEAIWVEVICKSQRLLIGTVYRAPENNEFYDIFDEIAKAGATELSISDYILVYSIIKLHRARQEPRIIRVEMYENKDTGKLRETIDSTPWWIGDLFEDVDDAWSTW
eukprot:gene17110-8627_t